MFFHQQRAQLLQAVHGGSTVANTNSTSEDFNAQLLFSFILFLNEELMIFRTGRMNLKIAMHDLNTHSFKHVLSCKVGSRDQFLDRNSLF